MKDLVHDVDGGVARMDVSAHDLRTAVDRERLAASLYGERSALQGLVLAREIAGRICPSTTW
jgi:hypothetical protein